jgi:hypothetical protein
MHPSRLVPVVILVTSLFLSALLVGPQLVLADDSPPSARPLSPDWIELLARKEQLRKTDPRAVGTSNERAPNPAGPDTPRRVLSRDVPTSKADMRQRLEQQRATIELYIAQGGPTTAVAGALRAQLAEDEARIETFPDGEFTIAVPALETGSHSIQLSTYAYTSCCPSDPLSFVFYNVGSSFDVNWDLQNVPISGRKWTGEFVCESTLFGYTWDAQHSGTDGWEQQDYGLQYQAGVCGTARYHARLFDRGYIDSHGQYGRWSFSEPHHDRAGDHCVDDWDGSQEVMHQAFLDQVGAPIPIVGAMYQVNWGNGGTFGCATADSIGWYINLVY